MSFAPCSLTNYTNIRLEFVVGQSWNVPELANVSHWSGVVSGWFNDTCILPAFQSMVTAHIRTMNNFSWSTGNDGIDTGHANLSVDFGAFWMPNATAQVVELWIGIIKGGIDEGVNGPYFNVNGHATSGPGESPPSGSGNSTTPGTSSTPGTSLARTLEIGAGAGAVAGGLAGATFLRWRRGKAGALKLTRTPSGAGSASGNVPPVPGSKVEGDSLDYLT